MCTHLQLEICTTLICLVFYFYLPEELQLFWVLWWASVWLHIHLSYERMMARRAIKEKVDFSAHYYTFPRARNYY